jgi:hypothetical protein
LKEGAKPQSKVRHSLGDGGKRNEARRSFAQAFQAKAGSKVRHSGSTELAEVLGKGGKRAIRQMKIFSAACGVESAVSVGAVREPPLQG